MTSNRSGAAFRRALAINVFVFALGAVGVLGFASWRYGGNEGGALHGNPHSVGATIDTVSPNVTLLEFWAPWCPPCRVQGEILKGVEPRVAHFAHVEKINVDQDNSSATAYGVRSIPTLVILKNGREVERFVGVSSADTVVDSLRRHAKG